MYVLKSIKSILHIIFIRDQSQILQSVIKKWKLKKCWSDDIHRHDSRFKLYTISCDIKFQIVEWNANCKFQSIHAFFKLNFHFIIVISLFFIMRKSIKSNFNYFILVHSWKMLSFVHIVQTFLFYIQNCTEHQKILWHWNFCHDNIVNKWAFSNWKIIIFFVDKV